MKNWYMWLVLSGIWIVTAVVGFLDDRTAPVSTGFRLAAAAIMTALAFVQRACEKRGTKGKRILNGVYAAVIGAMAIFLAVVILKK